MKRVLSFVLCLVLLCSFTSCSKATDAGHEVGMVGGRSRRVLTQVIEMSFAGTDQMGEKTILRVYNPNDEDYYTGLEYELEVQFDGAWYKTNYDLVDLPGAGGYFFPAEGVANFAFAPDPRLPAGTYRHIVKVHPYEQMEECVYAGFEFEVGQNVTMPPAETATFTSVEELKEAALAAKPGKDAVDLGSLEEFYVPTGLPQGYALYKITVGALDILYWYLPETVLSDEAAIEAAESRQEHFLFVTCRTWTDFGALRVAYGQVKDKYVIPEDGSNMVAWEENGDLLRLYLPTNYVLEDEALIFGADRYVKNERAIPAGFYIEEPDA